MAHIPTQVSDLLQDLAAQMPVILGRNLVGLYVYGSLTQRAFNPNRSEVDCIVVTQRDLSDTQFKKLDAWLDGNPIIWMNVLKSGLILYGPRPESFVPVITPEILFQALKREVGYLREEISEKPESEWRNVPSYRAYAVLTLCRIVYSFSKGTIVSKQLAARWALKHLPEEWGAIIRQAIEMGDAKPSAEISLSRIEQFIDFVDVQLHAVTAEQADVPGRRRVW